MTSTDHPSKTLPPALRWLLLLIGFTSVILGVAGIFLPVLPTVPFLLLSAACFTRSSERFYNWLLDHAHLGPMVRPYLDGHGLKKSTKLKAIGLIWLSIAFSFFLLMGKTWVQVLLFCVASGVTFYLLRQPTIDRYPD